MAKSDRTVVLFSRWFPYNKVKEQSFLVDELNLLKQQFKAVYIVPQQIEGDKYELPEGFHVDESLAKELNSIGLGLKLQTILSFSFLSELFKIKFSRKKMKYAIAARLAALVTQRWILNFSKDKSDVVLYSFWMDFTTLGFSMAKAKSPALKAVSRCHNFDIYGNVDNDYYVPFQRQMIEAMDSVCPDSFGGEQFIKERFPNSKCAAALMGVSKAGVDNAGSSDEVTRIFSCAYMIPRKRVGLMLDALVEVSHLRPDLKMEWQHVGAGPEWELLTARVNEVGESCSVIFKGNMSTEQLADHYATNPIDLFVNTSEKEGTPVSIMEAISRGIPIMATAFGGNKEIVDLGAGIALSVDPTPQEIAQKLIELVDSGQLKTLKTASLKVWEDHYNSDKNYRLFCERIATL